ncbi:hypothetical protein ACHAXS_004782 [Conticribra weissflogii]
MVTKPTPKILVFILTAASLTDSSQAWVPSTVPSISISPRIRRHGSHRRSYPNGAFSTTLSSKNSNNDNNNSNNNNNSNHNDDCDNDRQQLYKDEATTTATQPTEFGISYIGGDPCGSKYNDDPFDATSDNQSFKPGFPDDMKDRIEAMARERLKKEK